MDNEMQEAVDNVKKLLTARSVTKMVVRLVVGHCVAGTVKTALRNMNPEPDSKTDEVKLTVGAYGAGLVVSSAAKHAIDDEVDDLFNWTEALTKTWRKNKPPVPATIIVPPSE